MIPMRKITGNNEFISCLSGFPMHRRAPPPSPTLESDSFCFVAPLSSFSYCIDQDPFGRWYSSPTTWLIIFWSLFINSSMHQVPKRWRCTCSVPKSLLSVVQRSTVAAPTKNASCRHIRLFSEFPLFSSRFSWTTLCRELGHVTTDSEKTQIAFHMHMNVLLLRSRP